MDKDLDRLVKFAEMMLGHLKAAEETARALGAIKKFETGAELMQYEQSRSSFSRLAQMGDEALAPYRHELAAD